MSSAHEPQGQGRRAMNIILAIAVAVAFVGFFVGIRPAPAPNLPGMGTRASDSHTDALPGQSYRELRRRHFGLGQAVSSDLTTLRQGIPALLDPVEQTPEQRRAALAARAERRAYDGAPPTIPHGIDEQSAGSCLACHASGVRVTGRSAPVMAHRLLTNCTQCHVPDRTDGTVPAMGDHNSFRPVASVGSGSRAWQGAPPTIPHRVWLRDDCSSCHGVNGRAGIRSPHPDRSNCTQCHVPQADAQPWPGSL